MQPRFFNSEQKELKVSNVELLQSVKERAIDRITIVMSTDLMNDTIVTELGTLIADNPGKTKLFVQLHDGSGKNHVLLRSTTKTVDVKHSLIHFIEQAEGLDYRIN
jgi:DNA polymerase-3 subunit alpha